MKIESIAAPSFTPFNILVESAEEARSIASAVSLALQTPQGHPRAQGMPFDRNRDQMRRLVAAIRERSDTHA